MDKSTLRIVFMGTPEFAVESLQTLVEGGYNVVAVVTQPDKPVGRHQDTLQASPVKSNDSGNYRKLADNIDCQQSAIGDIKHIIDKNDTDNLTQHKYQ